MLVKKKFILSLLVIPFLFACNKPNTPAEPYPFEKDSIALDVTVNGPMDSVKNNDLTSYVTVLYNGEKLEPISKDDDITASGYFFSTSNDHPYYNRVKDTHVNINGESSNLKFYVCHYDNDCIYISNEKTITVKNSKALKPWVLWTVGTVVILLCVIMVYFTKRYKEKHG